MTVPELSATSKMESIKLEDQAPERSPPGVATAPSPIPVVKAEGSQSPGQSQDEMKSRSESVGTPGPPRPGKLSRKSSQKFTPREPKLFDHLPDATAESCSHFQVIPDCLYGSKHLGSTDNDALDCDCSEEWQNGENVACGEDSDCINRATKMECSGGNCSGGCLNQRFQRKEYAGVSVIKTEKKGYGLRADTRLQSNQFIYEYIGEVINEPTFRRRMLQYDNQGIKHFYFMSLSKSEFVDATKKGNLGRFCNHSCTPNCYVDKWVVGDKLRMGIFALRQIQPGEELVFNYNVDRYGADPQPCYCDEPNCVGFIGGKTQTERATKLPAAIVEALGIDGADGWDTAIAKKPRKKRPEEDDEEYVKSLQPRSMDEDDARKVMAALMQCKEKWIAVKLLERIEHCDKERVLPRVVRMHAYQILRTVLNTFKEDRNVVLQVLGLLELFPRLTRNKIADSKIELSIEPLTEAEDGDICAKAKELLDTWGKLEIGYRISRRKGDQAAPKVSLYEDRRGGRTKEDESPSIDKTSSPRLIDAPKGPRNSAPQRNPAAFHNGVRPRRPNFGGALPPGWFSARDKSGKTYFYDKNGTTTWQKPTQPASDTKLPSKAVQEKLAIQSIIDKVTKEGTPKQSASVTPNPSDAVNKDAKAEKWRALPVDKQMKIYENTIFPHIKHVLDKFRHKLPKEQLKRLAKDLSKKLVASDYKNNRVGDPQAALSDKSAKKMKKYVHDFLSRAVEKYGEHEATKPAPTGGATKNSDREKPEIRGTLRTSAVSPAPAFDDDVMAVDKGDEPGLSDNEDDKTPNSLDRKRKRDENSSVSTETMPKDGPELKRLKEDEEGVEGSVSSPPPPPPPPPESTMDESAVEEQKALREQEEALIRENEEAQRLEDEARQTQQMENAVVEMQKDISVTTALRSRDHQSDGSAAVDGQSKEAQKQEVMSH